MQFQVPEIQAGSLSLDVTMFILLSFEQNETPALLSVCPHHKFHYSTKTPSSIP